MAEYFFVVCQLTKNFFYYQSYYIVKMARVTVEDCVKVVPNRFELCLIANNRAKSILSGAKTTLDLKEKPSVIALREIASDLVDINKVRENIIESTKVKNAEFVDGQVHSGVVEDSLREDENSVPLSDNIFLNDNLAVDD